MTKGIREAQQDYLENLGKRMAEKRNRDYGMTKQEEIKEWAKKFLQGTAHNGYYDGLEVTMLEELSEQGAVIKVERELPKNPYPLDYDKLPPEFQEDDNEVTAEDVYLMTYNGVEKGKGLMLKAGYVAVEPLIEEG